MLNFIEVDSDGADVAPRWERSGAEPSVRRASWSARAAAAPSARDVRGDVCK